MLFKQRIYFRGHYDVLRRVGDIGCDYSNGILQWHVLREQQRGFRLGRCHCLFSWTSIDPRLKIEAQPDGCLRMRRISVLKNI